MLPLVTEVLRAPLGTPGASTSARRRSNALDQLGACVRAVVLSPQPGELRWHAPRSAVAEHPPHHRRSDRRGPVSRHGSIRPAPGPLHPRRRSRPCRRPPGSTAAGTPGAERPAHRPVPAVADHQVRQRHHLRVGEPVDHPRVRRRRQASRTGIEPVRRRQHPHRLVRQRLERHPHQPPARDPAPSTAPPPPAARRPPAAPRPGAGSSNIIGPVTCVCAGQRRGYSSCGNVATSTRSALSPPWNRSSGGSPTAARVSFISRRAPLAAPVTSTGSAARHSARPTGVRGGCAPNAKNGSPGSCTG